jgi:hypothetical protein
MTRPRHPRDTPLADLTRDEIDTLADVCGVAVRSADAWRFRRPPARKTYLIAETLHRGDPERWPDPGKLARAMVEMESGR